MLTQLIFKLTESCYLAKNYTHHHKKQSFEHPFDPTHSIPVLSSCPLAILSTCCVSCCPWRGSTLSKSSRKNLPNHMPFQFKCVHATTSSIILLHFHPLSGWGSPMPNVLPVDDAESWIFVCCPIRAHIYPGLCPVGFGWHVKHATGDFSSVFGKYWLLLWLVRGGRGFGQELRNWPLGHWPCSKTNLRHSGPNEAAIFPHFSTFPVGVNLLINCRTMLALLKALLSG